jgi:hypothetical protein
MKIKCLFLTAFIFTFSCIGFAQTSKKATDQEKKELFQLISKSDDEIKQAVTGGTSPKNLARDMSVEKTDLNKDGNPEYIVVIRDGGICGALGNCPDWVYQKSDGEYKLLLRTFGRELLLEKTSTNKFRDLRSEGGDSATESSFTIYKFGSEKYRADGCFTRIYATKGKKERIVAQKCSENE